MTKRMLVDATHGEETRVAVVSGNRLEELDFEFASRKQLKGNIYLAKVIRVEPSLQAAFVEYGGNRHGFLAFSEIHPDYYRIPVEDRAALLAEEERLEAAEARRWDAMAEAEERAAARAAARSAAPAPAPAVLAPAEQVSEPAAPVFTPPPPVAVADVVDEFGLIDALDVDAPLELDAPAHTVADDEAPVQADDEGPVQAGDVDGEVGEAFDEAAEVAEPVYAAEPEAPCAPAALDGEIIPPGDMDEDFDVVGGDEVDEGPQRRARPLRSYKIQEVIKRRQILLVQVTKEERGNKGAALTTYLSLPGRYCVLMPNTGRGGGISRKITNPADRRRLKDILSDLDIPGGMAVILRTAGLERAKPEIRRDLEYLLRLWDDIREQTLKSVAPALIYEEANLIKRAIRDVYADDIEEVWVDGEAGFRTAQNFMRMMMPSHTNRVQLYKDSAAPLFHRYQVEQQIDAIHSPIVQLRSGGYIVINPTEALVAIDVNSGRSTRERNIEETAFKTNLEAADEVARQLRLRDLAGLIVIDFIDMEDSRNNMAVERRLKEAMKNDRARIQVGRISSFGLMELSRQRLRPSLQETNFERCPHCDGAGVVRSVESAALHVLRAIADEGVRRRAAEILVYVPTRVALYLLNQKRADLSRIETRYGFRVAVANDDSLIGSEVLRIERMRARSLDEDSGALVSAERVLEETDRELAAADEDVGEETVNDVAGEEAANDAAGDGGVDGAGRRRRRRRRRGGRDGRDEGREGLSAEEAEADDEAAAEPGAEDADGEADGDATGEEGAVEAGGGDNGDANGERRGRRRRGRRGGRRERGMDEGGEGAAAEAGEAGPAPIIRAVLPAAESVTPLAAIDFDLILEGEEPVAPAPEIIITAPVAVEDVVTETVIVEAVIETETVEIEPAAEAPAKPARKRKTKAKAGEDAVDAAPAEAVEGEEAPAKPARKRKTKAKAGEDAVDAAPAPAEVVTETVVEETPVVEAPAVVEAPVDAAAAEAEAQAAAEAAAAKAAENLAARAAEKVNLPPEEPKRGWWRR